MVRFLEKRQGTLLMYARPDHFHNLKKKYENETKTNNTTVSPLILHIIADGIKNNVEYFIVYVQLAIHCASKKTHLQYILYLL